MTDENGANAPPPVPDSATCLQCGYSLRGLPEPVCPECGRAFFPGDPRTYRVGRQGPRWPRIAKAPPVWPVLPLAAVTVLYTYWSSKPFGVGVALSFGGCLAIPVVLGGFGVLLVDHVGRISAILSDRRRASADRCEPRKWHVLRWIPLPLCLAILLSVLFTAWPLKVRFHHSLPALEAAVARIEGGADPRNVRGRIGWFDVTSVHHYKSGALFFQTGMWGFDSVGIVHRPDDKPTRPSHKRLARNWFTEMW